MACAFVQAVAAAPSCQTVSLEPATASASNDPPGPPGPGASAAVPAGTAISPRPASSSATFPPAVLPSPSTCTCRRAQPAGTAGPAASHVPPLSVKTPATPGRAQLPAVTGFFLLGPNETAFNSSRPQVRPGAVAASACTVVSCDHCPATAAAVVPAVWIVPSLSSAMT